MELVLKTSDSARGRGFESHSPRHTGLRPKGEEQYLDAQISIPEWETRGFPTLRAICWSSATCFPNQAGLLEPARQREPVRIATVGFESLGKHLPRLGRSLLARSFSLSSWP